MVVPVFPSLTAGFISVFIDKTTIKELCNNVVTYNFLKMKMIIGKLVFLLH